MTDLPDPMVPAEVDLRGMPFPVSAFLELAMQQFGIDRETAERQLRAAAARCGIPVEEIGHG